MDQTSCIDHRFHRSPGTVVRGDVIWCALKETELPYNVFAQSTPASPYLLSLGLSKSLMAIVFVAGPLSGLIVQPLVGTANSLVTRPLSYSNYAIQEC